MPNMTASALAPQARALAWHGFFTLVFCLLLAGALTALGLADWRSNAAYSVPIGLTSWLVIDLGRLLGYRNSEQARTVVTSLVDLTLLGRYRLRTALPAR